MAEDRHQVPLPVTGGFMENSLTTNESGSLRWLTPEQIEHRVRSTQTFEFDRSWSRQAKRPVDLLLSDLRHQNLSAASHAGHAGSDDDGTSKEVTALRLRVTGVQTDP